MKQARAIFLGGELLDASEVKDYSEYYNKGFVCPFCLEKVFYQQEFTRQLSDKSVPISPMFKHHKGDPFGCEARAKTSEGKKILEVLSSESREQRRPIWKKYLWEMFKEGNKRNGFGFDSPAKVYLSTPIYKDIFKGLDRNDPHWVIAFASSWLHSTIFSTTYHGPSYYDQVSVFTNEIMSKDGFFQSYKILTAPKIHHAICMELIKILGDESLDQVGKRICACLIAGGRFPKDYLIPGGPIHQLERLCEKRAAQQSWNIKGSKEDIENFNKVMMGYFFPFLLELIISIDWLELSKEPWSSLVISKRGKGFAKNS